MKTNLINALLDLDPESRSRLKKLEGKAVNIELRPFKLELHCHIEQGNMQLKSGHIETAETTIRGTPLQMFGVMLDKENRQHFFADDLVMEGNAEVGQQMVALFDQLEIDWEEMLSHFIGDAPAHRTGRLLRGIRSWIKETGECLVQDINEYTHEEAAWFPAREAMQDFFDGVDELRMDVDRVEARVVRLLGPAPSRGTTQRVGGTTQQAGGTTQQVGGTTQQVGGTTQHIETHKKSQTGEESS